MAKKDNIQVSFGINGMERQGFSHLIDEKTYTFMQNGNIETDDESVALTNEQSNYLCSKLKPEYRDWETDRKSTRLNSSHSGESRMPSSA